ncbi:PSD1 and planctomycete cytochrome C domain-containing protein [Algoriphagus sp. SE2]|uniref:PSD1 and planctomycete cytochrome C domain-containing protein n=1 Tax=Algoriphagus sp. SE2 TaxID=3141536 RepID=UPI0031CD597A
MVLITPVLGQNQIAEEIGSFWLWEFFGRLHPMIVHFPIALLIFGAALELLSLRKFESKFRPAISILIIAGGISAIISAIFGYQLANSEGTTGAILDLHQQIGIGTAVLSIILLFFLVRVGKQPGDKTRILLFRSILFVTAIAVSAAGHFGGSLTHGEDFLTETLPWNQEESSIEKTPINLAVYQTELNPEREMKLIGEVRMVFAHNCYKCHSGAKIEGELRLDEKEYAFAGGENGEVIVPGNPKQSEIIRRINLRKGHKDVMPSKGELLSDQEKELLSLWIEKGAPWPDNAPQQSIYRVAELAPRKPVLPPSTNGLSNPIDIWVDDYFEKNNLQWSDPVDDRTYLRRIYLDVIGLIPSPEELEEFYKDSRENKREIWLQNLLNRDRDYAIHWLTFWNDALRNDYTGTGYITNGRYNITDWLYKSLESNKPYNEFVKELLNPTEKSKGFIEGIRWRGTVNASQRTEMQAAQNVGQVILGLNLKCASCHDSFISDWKLEESYAFANIFADSTLEISRCEQPTGKMADTRILWEELGDIDSAAGRSEKLKQLAENLVQPANGRMYRTIVNRIWKQMMGRGLVEPVDEMDNEPWSQDLLDWLATEFVDSSYDLKNLIYLIGTSKIYQAQSISYNSPDLILADDYKFSGAVRKRLTAEQFSDAVSQFVYPIFKKEDLRYNPEELNPEKGTKLDFARASLVANNSFLTALGRPNREIVSTSRDSQASLLQALELTNGTKLDSALRSGAKNWKSNYQTTEKLTEALYLKALNRKPLEKEVAVAKAAMGEVPEEEQIQDFIWAVLLLPEFQLIY